MRKIVFYSLGQKCIPLGRLLIIGVCTIHVDYKNSFPHWRLISAYIYLINLIQNKVVFCIMYSVSHLNTILFPFDHHHFTSPLPVTNWLVIKNTLFSDIFLIFSTVVWEHLPIYTIKCYANYFYNNNPYGHICKNFALICNDKNYRIQVNPRGAYWAVLRMFLS